MALLDRFRTQSRHKSPDAAVRLAFVQEIPLDERDLLSEIAREDTDPRVRRAAVAKLLDPAALAGVANDDADEAVRSQANSMLRDIALESFEGAGTDAQFGRTFFLLPNPMYGGWTNGVTRVSGSFQK